MRKKPIPLYGAQTKLAIENFPVSGLTFSRSFIRALGLIKGAAASVNRGLGLLEPRVARAIEQASGEVARGRHDAQFPVDIFQTGSGTSTNMNANEVIAKLASRRLRRGVHPNDHVNMSQSSNDVIPAAIHLSALLEIRESLLPALRHLQGTIERKAKRLAKVVKTGRTHLMDALPITMGQELSGWAAQIEHGIERIESVIPRLSEIPLGATAVGTGLNAYPRFGPRAAALLSRRTGLRLTSSGNKFESLSSQDAAVELSGQLKTVAVSLTKISQDLRWMNSGPTAGLGEIQLPALQAGSSIMPGKVNPVIPESVLMVCAQVIGNDATITFAGASGNFQLNTMLPVIAYNLLQSIGLLSNSSRLLADRAIAGFTVNEKRLAELLERNPILVTALNPRIGYEKGAAIAKRAYREGRKVKDVAAEILGLSQKELKRILDPKGMTRGGIL